MSIHGLFQKRPFRKSDLAHSRYFQNFSLHDDVPFYRVE